MIRPIAAREIRNLISARYVILFDFEPSLATDEYRHTGTIHDKGGSKFYAIVGNGHYRPSAEYWLLPKTFASP